MTDRHRQTLRTLALAAIAIGVAGLAGLAFAQELALPESPSGASGFLLAVIGGAVAWLRSLPAFEKVDGPVTVPLFAMVVGGAVGAVGAPIGLVDTSATEVLGRGWDGAAAGILAAIETVFLVSLTKYVGKIFRRDESGKLKVDLGETLEAAKGVVQAKPSGPIGSAVAFLLETAERLLGQAPTGSALVALYPLIVKWAQSPEILTDDVRAKIQTDVLGALNRAGLVGQDLV